MLADDETLESSTEEEEEPSEEEEEPDEDPEDKSEEEDKPKPKQKKGEGPPEGSPRWNKIYAKSKMADRYLRYGPPEKVEQALSRLASIEAKLAEKQVAGEGKDKESQDLKEKRDRIRKQMRDYEPNLEKLEALIDDNSRYRESLQARAGEAVIETMEEAGFEVDEDSYTTMAGVLEEIVKKDPRILTIYWTNPEKAIKLAYKSYAEPFQAESERKSKAKLLKGKERLDNLPKAHKGTGAPPSKGKKKEPQSVEEGLSELGAALDELE